MQRTTATSMPTPPSTTPARRTLPLPSARGLIGGVYAICVVGLVAVFVGEIAFTDVDPHKSEGPIESIVSVSVVGTTALAICLGLGLWLVRTPERARIGAVVFGALSVVGLVLFWSGAPGLFGATAAWLAGMTRGGRPSSGAARAAGIVGAFIALVNVLLTVGGVLFAAVNGS